MAYCFFHFVQYPWVDNLHNLSLFAFANVILVFLVELEGIFNIFWNNIFSLYKNNLPT